MIINVASFIGGVGKTTTAIHLAAFLNQLGPTLLLDGNPNLSGNALSWNRGNHLPYRVEHFSTGEKLMGEFAHTVIDTGVWMRTDDFRGLAESDLWVIPTGPRNSDTLSLIEGVKTLRLLPEARYRVLIARVAPRGTEAQDTRTQLEELGLPLFAREIPNLTAFQKAERQGVLVQDVSDPRTKRAWDAYEAAGQELITIT